MITRSLSRLATGARQSPVVGLRHKGILPHCGEAGCLGPHPTMREQAEGVTVGSNYWSATTITSNPTNAWNVNFNNGNVNNTNKSNNLFVRAVRGGS